MGAENEASLEQQIAALTTRVSRLEQAIHQMSTGIKAEDLARASADTITSALTSGVTVQATSPVLETIPQAPLDQPPGQMHVDQRSGVHSRDSLESRIGSQFFNRIGIFALLIGTAWFLKLAFDSHWIGPVGRILVGLVAGSALILWSERFRSKGYSAFAYSLKAVGSGVLYLSLWAAYSVFHLLPAGVAFVAMILVTAWNGFMSWVQDSELLALYAIVGGFSTPLLLSTGENHELVLFGYVLILDMAVLTLVVLRPWSRLLLGAFVGTLSFSLGWYFSFYSDSQFVLTSIFATAFFAIFAIAPRLTRPRTGIARQGTPLNGAADTSAVLVVLPLANAAFGFIELYALLNEPLRRWAQPWTAVAFAAFYLLLLQLQSPRLPREEQTLLSSLHLSLAVVFLTLAIPLEANGRWITIGWLVEGVALMWTARRLRLLLLRVLAAGSLVLGFGWLLIENFSALVMRNFDSPGPVIFNARFATYLAAVAAFAISAYISTHSGPVPDDEPLKSSGTESEDRVAWSTLAAASLLAMNFLMLLAGAEEIHTYWWGGQTFPQYRPDFSARSMNAQFTYSAWAMLFGAVLLTGGFWRRSAFLRWQALVLVALTVAKVFLYDIGRLSQGYRVLSFLGLGALLLGVSFVYQRDLLHLRDGKPFHKDQNQEQPQ